MGQGGTYGAFVHASSYRLDGNIPQDLGAHFGGFREQMHNVLLLDMAIHTLDAARFMASGTIILAGLIVGWQVTSWILTDDWNPFPISRALSLAHLERPAIYVTASVSDRPPPSFDFQAICDWFLDLPAGGFLLAVAAVLLSFSMVGASIEKQFDTTDE